jgi:tagatose 1,6-diphosphate aldolase
MSTVARMQQLLTSSGKITIAAIDHRGLLKKMLHPENPETTTDHEIKDWKKLMCQLYSSRISGLLIDPSYGLDLVDTTKSCGWLLSMEQTGYRGGQAARVTDIVPGWSVQAAKEAGASGVKLLLYYDPENKSLAEQQLALAEQVGEECQRAGMVYLLEPLSYNIEGSREAEVLRIVQAVAHLPVDIFKFEYPGTQRACETISSIVTKPWVLLSAGADYETYKEQLRAACSAGASGMAVGRAAWQEFGQYESVERERFLRETATARIEELSSIVETYGKAVHEIAKVD